MTYRTLTVHGAGMALAMLRGHKPCELRKVANLRAGWYNLHVGEKTIGDACQRVLEATWPTAPCPSDELPKSAIYGQVFLGRMANAGDVEDAWMLQEYGKWVYTNEASLEFAQPLLNVSGAQGIWYVKGETQQQYIKNAVATATHLLFAGRWPGVRDARRSSCRVTTPWTKRLARKPRSDLGKRSRPAGGLMSAAKLRALDRPALEEPPPVLESGRSQPAANLPASQELGTPAQAHPIRAAANMSSMARRIAAGRDWPQLCHLMQEHFFSEMRPFAVTDTTPRPGLFAWSTPDNCYVFIVTAVWTRRGVPLVDVAPLRAAVHHGEAGAMTAQMRDVVTRQKQDLSDVGLHFQAVPSKASRAVSLVFTRRPAGAPRSGAAAELSYNCRVAELWRTAPGEVFTQPPPRIAPLVVQITPQGLLAHLEAHAAGPRPHRAVPRPDKTSFWTIHDVPVPILVDATPHRCLTCKALGDVSTYTVTVADVKVVFPNILSCRSLRYGSVLMTRRFLLYLIRNFIGQLAIRACRRSLVDLYSTNALAMHGAAAAIHSISTVPSNHMLGVIVIRCHGPCSHCSGPAASFACNRPTVA